MLIRMHFGYVRAADVVAFAARGDGVPGCTLYTAGGHELMTALSVDEVRAEIERAASRWGFDAEFETAVRVLAETPRTDETLGSARDPLVDALVAAARTMVAREENRD